MPFSWENSPKPEIGGAVETKWVLSKFPSRQLIPLPPVSQTVQCLLLWTSAALCLFDSLYTCRTIYNPVWASLQGYTLSRRLLTLIWFQSGKYTLFNLIGFPRLMQSCNLMQIWRSKCKDILEKKNPFILFLLISTFECVLYTGKHSVSSK